MEDLTAEVTKPMIRHIAERVVSGLDRALCRMSHISSPSWARNLWKVCGADRVFKLLGGSFYLCCAHPRS